MYERRGNLQSALIYVGIAALISGILAAIGGGLLALIGGVIGALVGFVVFTYAVFFIGRSQGGTGTYDEVAYSFSLFSAPLSVIGALIGLVGAVLPILACLVGPPILLILFLANVYLGYLAVQSSMNLTDKTKAIITLVLAALIYIVVVAVINGIFGVGAYVAAQ
jgi:hypothetical protein